MRVYIIVASLALLVIGKANGTVVDTGADAQKYCELLVEGSFHDNVEARSAGAWPPWRGARASPIRERGW